MADVGNDLEALVRRVDEDRWLASRFAPRVVQARLIAIYAVNYEIARTAEAVTEAAIGDIRFTWWRDAIAEIHAGTSPRAHPVTQAYAGAARELPEAPWTEILEARRSDLDATPFPSWQATDGYLERTAGALLKLAAAACGEQAGARLVRSAALAWGYVGLARAEAFWNARGRGRLPGAIGEALARARAAQVELKAHKLPSRVFPAFGYVALAPLHARALAAKRKDVPLFLRQLVLVRAAVTGRL